MAKQVKKTTTKGKTVTGVPVQKVWTACRDKNGGAPVVCAWEGVRLQSPCRWLLAKDVYRATAFIMDAEKGYLSKEAAAASLSMKPCFYISGKEVCSGFFFLDENKVVRVVSSGGHTLWTHAKYNTEAAAYAELIRENKKLLKNASMMLTKSIRLWKTAKKKLARRRVSK